MKKTILLNEGLRRLTNCSPELDWKEKARWLTELNLFMLNAGYNHRFRNSLTNKIVGIYKHILTKHYKGTNMYRDSDSMSKTCSTLATSTAWYKKLGFKLAIKIPETPDQLLSKQIKKRLESYTGDKILITESHGTKLSSTLRRPNCRSTDICHRKDCKVCSSGPSEGKCYHDNVGYRILCNREPCTTNIDTNKVDTDNLTKQLDNLPMNLKESDRPAIYEGETFRSSYTRSKQHWQKYNTKSGQKTSFMYHHTMTNHNGKIGPEKGINYYKFQITARYKNNLKR